MVSNYLVKFLEEKEVPTITKKRHTYLTYYGLEQQDTYVLKEGIVKTSIILRDGREFNISYMLNDKFSTNSNCILNYNQNV